MNDVHENNDGETSESPLEQFRSIVQAVAKGMEAFRRRASEIAAVVGPVLTEISASVQKLPDRTINLQRKLAERGWYAMPEMPLPDLFALEDVFATGRDDVVDDRMTQMVEGCLDETEAQLISDFPARASLFKEAFEAHRDGRFASAINLFLAQTDGICSELLGVHYFNVQPGTSDPRTRRVIEALQLEAFQEALLEPLMTRGGVSARDTELGQYPDSLHRHQILHGKDTNYATKINSLKTISLVGYMGGLAKHTIDDIRAKRASGSAP